jgi:integrase
MRWDLISRNAAALSQPPKQERHEIEPLSVGEIRTLLRSSRQHRLYGLFVLAVHTGMRQGELLALRWQDIDLDKRLLRVRATMGRVNGQPAFLPPKSEQSRRTLKLSSDSVGALHEQRQRIAVWRELAGARWVDLDLVFPSMIGTALNSSNVTHAFQQALADAGLRRARFHDLRHSAASFLLESGVPMRVVQDQLGHSGLAYTIATYTHISATLKQEVADAMDALALIEPDAGLSPVDAERNDRAFTVPRSQMSAEATGVKIGVTRGRAYRHGSDADENVA